MVDRVEDLLRTGPGAGVTMVLTTDRSGFHHRVSSAVAARLVLRQATPDDVVAFGLDPRATPGRCRPAAACGRPPAKRSRSPWYGPTAPVAPSGRGRAARRRAGRRWKDVPADRLPRRVDPLPEEISAAEAEALRVAARPAGPAVCTPAVGGDHLAPLDIDLAASGSTFLVSGP